MGKSLFFPFCPPFFLSFFSINEYINSSGLEEGIEPVLRGAVLHNIHKVREISFYFYYKKKLSFWFIGL